MKTIIVAALLAVSMTATAADVVKWANGDYTIRNDDGTTTFIYNDDDGDVDIFTSGQRAKHYSDIGDGKYMGPDGIIQTVPILGIIPQR